MFDLRSTEEWRRIWRFYQAGIVNATFGYVIFAAFVALGMNIYVAQILSHVTGMAFNFLTYSRYVFRGHAASILRYLGAYAGQYAVSVSVLAAASAMGFNPYLAGFAAIAVISAVNYFVLKLFVYRITDLK